MIVAIVGSRDIRNTTLSQVLEKIPKNCTEIVSGGARGADQLARKAAEHLDIPFTEFPPEYDKYGKKATILRNRLIAGHCDYLIAVWDGCSRGTASTIDFAVRLGKPCEIIRESQLPDYIRRTTEK